MNYNIRKTDISIQPITVPEDTVIDDLLDVSLIGRITSNYGTEVNTNFLNILENFACPEDDTSTVDNASPDLTKVSLTQLHHPTTGQFWYNSTRQMIYFWEGSKWTAVPNRGQYAANWGMVAHNAVLPKPVNASGKIFEYDECIWTVSPATINGAPDTFNCNTDGNARVTMQYRYAGTEGFVNGIANYLIIGIEGNVDNGFPRIPPIVVSPTPTPTPSVTPSTTITMTPSRTPASTPTATPTKTPPVTPSKTPQATPPNTPPSTPTATPTPTPSNTVITYCWRVNQMCLGFTGYRPDTNERIGFNILKQGINPAPGSCQNVVSNANATGSMLWKENYARFCNPAVNLNFSIVGSDGSVVNQIIPLSLMKTASSFGQGIVEETVMVNGQPMRIQANITWNKTSGNRNVAYGNLSAQITFPDIASRC